MFVEVINILIQGTRTHSESEEEWWRKFINWSRQQAIGKNKKSERNSQKILKLVAWSKEVTSFKHRSLCSLGKVSRYPLEGRLTFWHKRSKRSWEKKYPCPHRESNCGCPVSNCAVILLMLKEWLLGLCYHFVSSYNKILLGYYVSESTSLPQNYKTDLEGS